MAGRGRCRCRCWHRRWSSVAFLLLPLVGLVVRAPWGDLWSILRGSDASAGAAAVAVDIDSRDRGVAGDRRAAGLGAGPDRLSRAAVAARPGHAAAGAAAGGRRGRAAAGVRPQRDSSAGTSTSGSASRSRSRPAAVIMAETFVAMPFLIITVEGALRSADLGFEEAAATLGAGRMTVFRRVTVPLVAPSLVAGAVLCWARALGEFGATITFAGSFPGRTQTMPIAVYYALETDPDAAIVLSLVLLLVSVTVLVTLRDRWLRGGLRPSDVRASGRAGRRRRGGPRRVHAAGRLGVGPWRGARRPRAERRPASPPCCTRWPG